MYTHIRAHTHNNTTTTRKAPIHMKKVQKHMYTIVGMNVTSCTKFPSHNFCSFVCYIYPSKRGEGCGVCGECYSLNRDNSGIHRVGALLSQAQHAYRTMHLFTCLLSHKVGASFRYHHPSATQFGTFRWNINIVNHICHPAGILHHADIRPLLASFGWHRSTVSPVYVYMHLLVSSQYLPCMYLQSIAFFTISFTFAWHRQGYCIPSL